MNVESRRAERAKIGQYSGSGRVKFGLPFVPAPVSSLLLGIFVVAGVELGAQQGWISPFVAPAPSEMVRSLVDSARTGVLFDHTASTMLAALGGFAIAAVLAVTFATVMASSRYLERMLTGYVTALQTLPKIAVAPLILLWLGFGLSAKLTIVVVSCFFPILINALQGLKIRERELYELFVSLGASKWRTVRYLRIPLSLPYIFAGLHIGLIFSLIGAVTAELVGSADGLGVLLLQRRAAFDLAGSFSVLIILMIIGLAMHFVMKLAERRVAFWAADVTDATQLP